ncbi:hypothetical protein HK100_000651 [Physocladia obscura]|uniref:Methyltransferase domain-containing protein n=1 Tax=Physocladia obscura TaxID=109957 RepID=A0AAD5XHI1_9FUNG|nr:hypothetical protein HK100_000651 [Physocladia obscura]
MGNGLSNIVKTSPDASASGTASVMSQIRSDVLKARLSFAKKKESSATETQTSTRTESANKSKGKRNGKDNQNINNLSLAIPPPPNELLPIAKESSPVFKSGPSWLETSNFYDDNPSPGIPSPPVDLGVISYNATIAKEWVPSSIGGSANAAADSRSSKSTSNMREYHPIGSSNYILPVDEDEQTRLEFQHYMLKHAFNGDIVCQDIRPILEAGGAKVLDVGCAKGAWLHSVNALYPNAQYFGVDIAGDAVKNGREANNITLTVGNILEGLPYENNTFDYIHQRNLLGLGIKKIQCVRVIRELIRVAKPGAWIELVEADLTLFSVATAVKDRGFDLYAGTNLMDYVDGQGLRATNVDLKTVSIPLNWGEGSIGRSHALSVRTMFFALEDYMHQVLGISREEYRKMVNECYEEWGEYKSFVS